jgi:sugar phosphate isomerase/epimerase
MTPDPSIPAPRDLSRLCVHTITTKPWTIEEAVPRFAAAGVRGITVWRTAFEGRRPAAVARLIREHGLSVVSLCRGGFFPSPSAAERAQAIEENKRCVDEAAELGAPHIVLVCGSAPGQSLEASRGQIADGMAAVLPHAAAAGVRLAIEPLHPMYAGDRSAVNTVGQARELCRLLGSPSVGIALDVYHTWWDERLEGEIAACGREGTLLAFHICDWRTPTTDLLEDRGIMGDGCIPIRRIRNWVEAAGFAGFHEVEIFSRRLWAGDQQRYLDDIVASYRTHA